MMRTSVWWWGLAAGVVATFAVVGLVAVLATEETNGPVHHAISRSFLGYPPQRAVDAFNIQDWNLALREARQCVAINNDRGLREQARLESEHAAMPSAVRTTNEEMKAIMRRGSLNSLAHCSLVEGEAANRLGQA